MSRGGVGRVKGSEAKYGRGWLGGGEGNNWRKKAPPLLSRKRVVEGVGGGKVVRWGGWLLWFNIYQIFAL